MFRLFFYFSKTVIQSMALIAFLMMLKNVLWLGTLLCKITQCIGDIA